MACTPVKGEQVHRQEHGAEQGDKLRGEKGEKVMTIFLSQGILHASRAFIICRNSKLKLGYWNFRPEQEEGNQSHDTTILLVLMLEMTPSGYVLGLCI